MAHETLKTREDLTLQKETGMKYFIIIDMQNDFTTGALRNEAATSNIRAIADKAAELKAQGYTIIATRDTHHSDYLQTQEGRNLPVEHCIENTAGWQVAEEIIPHIDKYVDKPSFGYADWRDVIGEAPEAIAMCGTCTAICVASNFTILKATYRETPITIYKDLCACLTKETHNAAITVMQTQQAIIE